MVHSLLGMLRVCRPSRRSDRHILLAAIGLAGGVLLGHTALAQSGTNLVANSWQVQCSGEQDCVAYYVRSGLQIFIGRSNERDDVVLAEFRLPTTTTAGAPFTIQVDDNWSGAMQIESCNDNFCHLALDISQNQELIDQFRQHRVARAAYVSGDSIVVIPFDLSGFTEAMNRVAAAG